jgi:hypothetical protein
MYGTGLLMLLMLSNTCEHRIVVTGRDCEGFRLVTPAGRRPCDGPQVTDRERPPARQVAPTPAQSLAAAPVQHPVPQPDKPTQLPAAVFLETVPAGTCSDGKCSSSVFRRWRRR